MLALVIQAYHEHLETEANDMELFNRLTSDTIAGTASKIPFSSNQMFKQADLSTRKSRIGKSISPGTEKGSLEITLLYRNKANFLRENIVINEFVPANFSIVGSNNRFGATPRDGGTMISWLIDKVNPEEEVEISYSLKADEATSSLKHLDGKAFK
jgi:hypothetical protein